MVKNTKKCGHRKVETLSLGKMCFQCGSFKVIGETRKWKKLPPEVIGSYCGSGFLYDSDVTKERIEEIELEMYGEWPDVKVKP